MSIYLFTRKLLKNEIGASNRISHSFLQIISFLFYLCFSMNLWNSSLVHFHHYLIKSCYTLSVFNSLKKHV